MIVEEEDESELSVVTEQSLWHPADVLKVGSSVREVS